MGERVWSDFQKAIFSDVADGEGSTFVRARAGTGKTTTIVEGLNYIPSGLKACLFAFNKSIAKELTERAPRGVDVSTIHAYGLKVVSRGLGRLTIDGDRTMNIAKALFGDKIKSTHRRGIVKLVSVAKNTLGSTLEDLDRLVDEFQIDYSDDEIPRQEDRDRFVANAGEVLRMCEDTSDGCLDFDDMIWLPHVHNLRGFAFDRVFVDEAQDLNAAQIELVLKAAKGRRSRICAIGDDRQAIYKFRGADADAVNTIIRKIDAKVLPLSVTYRCARSIVEHARRFVPDYQCGRDFDGTVAASDEVAMLKNARPGDFILSRVNAPLIRTCLQFLREGRPASVQGRDIGAQLSTLVRKSNAVTALELAKWVRDWRTREVERLAALERDTSAVDDKAETILVLTEGATTVSDVEAKINKLFADDDSRARITLSSTHKAKGLERDRVWMLADTYRPGRSQEEDNLYYVATTRARDELHLVRTAKV
jgi:superfamily I DNA/RNA helicase